MYVQEQWLWDRELKQPIQFLGYEIFLGNKPARWHVRENGVEKYYEFHGFKWWQDRYCCLLDGNADRPVILMSNCPTGASQFYGGPENCIEISLKPKTVAARD